MAMLFPPISGNFMGCRLTRTTTQSISNGTLTAVQWDAEDYDTNAFHDNSTNNTRITVPITGKYLFETSVVIAAGGGGERFVEFYKNGTTRMNGSDIPLSGSVNSAGGASAVLSLTAGDYIEVRVYQDSGGSLNLLQDATRYPWVEVSLLNSSAGATPSPVLGVSSYRPGSDSVIHTEGSGTLLDLDATNCKVTFTAPASGNVLVHMEGFGYADATHYLMVGLRESTTIVAGPNLAWNSSAAGGRTGSWFYVTGISAGSHTYKAAIATSGGSSGYSGGPNFGDFLMIVIAAP